ncbi:mechanosensitive ion channel family protein [Fusobacterium perfoetens]|uniref:mechanosensitive ion channel family protein n=1 Tax=Fusobacterium perfoetens TaxID=852 RepID=UPI001F1ABFFD|nr:mechanosensitive ion channel family protein [Fusobacterium perfoetens]MCF2624994.1 mechanosensitive ion channel family protein [Fusobacterium perfoetens]
MNNNILSIIKNVEDKNGNLIFQIFVTDAVILLIKIISFIIIMYVGKFFVNAVDKYVDKISINKIDAGAKQFTKSFVKLGIYGIFFLFAMLMFGFKEQSIITMISAISLGIGISLKEFLSNFAGGVVILFSRPFTVGNFIEMNDAVGEVSEIGVFSTCINTLDSRKIIIPNNVVISKNITNYDANKYRRIQLTVPIAYEADPRAAVLELQDITKTFKGIENDRIPFINIMSYGSSSVNIEYLVWTENKGYHDYYNVRGDLMQYIIKRFAEKNIEIPYNKLDVHFYNYDENKEK